MVYKYLMKPKKPFVVRKQYRSPRKNTIYKLDEKAISMREERMTLAEIARHYDCTREAVRKYLNKRGVDTSKRLWEVPCTFCGNILLRQRSWIRRQRRHYCNQQCYRNHLRTPGYTRRRPRDPYQRMTDILKGRPDDFEITTFYATKDPDL